MKINQFEQYEYLGVSFVMSRTDAQNGLLIIYNLHVLKFDVFERETTFFMHNNLLNRTLD